MADVASATRDAGTWLRAHPRLDARSVPPRRSRRRCSRWRRTPRATASRSRPALVGSSACVGSPLHLQPGPRLEVPSPAEVTLVVTALTLMVAASGPRPRVARRSAAAVGGSHVHLAGRLASVGPRGGSRRQSWPGRWGAPTARWTCDLDADDATEVELAATAMAAGGSRATGGGVSHGAWRARDDEHGDGVRWLDLSHAARARACCCCRSSKRAHALDDVAQVVLCLFAASSPSYRRRLARLGHRRLAPMRKRARCAQR